MKHVLVLLTTRIRFLVLLRTEIPCSGTVQGVSRAGHVFPCSGTGEGGLKRVNQQPSISPDGELVYNRASSLMGDFVLSRETPHRFPKEGFLSSTFTGSIPVLGISGCGCSGRHPLPISPHHPAWPRYNLCDVLGFCTQEWTGP